MIALLLSFALALQAIPAKGQEPGTVSGVLRDAQGRPVAGIRMAALARPDSLDEAISSPSMSSLTQTDEQGRYTLRDIPPGRYFIAAGRLDVQTYFPGTTELTMAKEVAITAGLAVSGIDFALGGFSVGRAPSGESISGPPAVIPIRVTVEGGGKMPVSGNGKVTIVKLDIGMIAYGAFLSSASVNVSGPYAYRVTVENLPDTFAVKSMTYGSTDLLTNSLRLTPLNFPGPPLLNKFGFPPEEPAALQAYLDRVGFKGTVANNDTPELMLFLTAPTAPPTPTSTLTITLEPVPSSKPIPGARVSGRVSVPGVRTVYVSGIAGAVYSDGTFEVYGVPPGRHSIVTRDNPTGLKPLAASVVVESSNVDSIVLGETTMLPKRAWELSPPRPVAGHAAGNVPLARLSATVIDEASKKPVPDAKVVISNGSSNVSLVADVEGHFELPALLPGAYDFEVQAFGHANAKHTIEIDDKDTKIELLTQRLF